MKISNKMTENHKQVAKKAQPTAPRSARPRATLEKSDKKD